MGVENRKMGQKIRNGGKCDIINLWAPIFIMLGYKWNDQTLVLALVVNIL